MPETKTERNDEQLLRQETIDLLRDGHLDFVALREIRDAVIARLEIGHGRVNSERVNQGS